MKDEGQCTRFFLHFHEVTLVGCNTFQIDFTISTVAKKTAGNCLLRLAWMVSHKCFGSLAIIMIISLQ